MSGIRALAMFLPGLLLAGLSHGAAPPLPAASPYLDCFGDPLPPGALARLGTVRLRHEGTVCWLAFSPDGRSLFSAGDDLWVHQHDAATGAPRLSLGKHPRKIVMAALRPAGKELAALDVEGEIHLWDLTSGKKTRTLAARKGSHSLTFSAAGKILVCGGPPALVWDATSWAAPRLLPLEDDSGQHPFFFSPDGSKFYSLGADRTIQCWDLRTGKLVRSLSAGSEVRSFCLSPDGLVLTARSAGKLQLWDPATGKLTRTLATGETENTSPLVFSPDGRSLAWQPWGGEPLEVLDLPAGKTRLILRGPACWIHALAFSPDGRRLASGGDDGRVRLWDLESGKELLAHPATFPFFDSLASSPDGKTAAAGSTERDRILWDSRTGQVLHRLPGNASELRQLAFSGDGKELVSLTEDGYFCRVDVKTGRRLARFRMGQARPLDLSADDRALALSLYDEGSWVVDLATGKEGRRFGSFIYSAAFLGPGHLLATVGQGRSLQVWDAGKGEEVQSFETEGGFRWLARSADRRTLLAGGKSRAVRFVLSGGRLVRAESFPWTQGGHLALSADGRMLAAVDREDYLEIRETWTGQVRDSWPHTQRAILSLHFFPDGRLASGDRRTVLVWKPAGPAGPRRDLTPGQLEKLWSDLAGDARPAFTAIQELSADPARAVPFLARRVRPVPPPDPRLLARLLVDLDHDEFVVRRAARRKLEDLGDLAREALRAASKEPTSPEVSLQVRALLRRLEEPTAEPGLEKLRVLRAVEALERAGAQEVLRELGRGTTGALLTREARASLARLQAGEIPGR